MKTYNALSYAVGKEELKLSFFQSVLSQCQDVGEEAWTRLHPRWSPLTAMTNHLWVQISFNLVFCTFIYFLFHVYAMSSKRPNVSSRLTRIDKRRYYSCIKSETMPSLPPINIRQANCCRPFPSWICKSRLWSRELSFLGPSSRSDLFTSRVGEGL